MFDACVLKQDCYNKQTLRQLQPSSTDLSCICAIYKCSHAWLSFCLYFFLSSYFSPPLTYALPSTSAFIWHFLFIFPFVDLQILCPPKIYSHQDLNKYFVGLYDTHGLSGPFYSQQFVGDILIYILFQYCSLAEFNVSFSWMLFVLCVCVY